MDERRCHHGARGPTRTNGGDVARPRIRQRRGATEKRHRGGLHQRRQFGWRVPRPDDVGHGFRPPSVRARHGSARHSHSPRRRVDGFALPRRGHEQRTGGEKLTENPEEQSLTLVDLAQRLDTQNMVGFVRHFVADLRAGFSAVNASRFPWLDELKNAPWSGVLCLGMGGSAAGGDFLSTLSSHGGGCPIIVHRDYTLPSWFDGTWLVL